MESQSVYLNRLIDEANNALEKVNNNYSSFSFEELNWKPAPDSWSIGEVYGHLINSNALYFNSFEQKIKESPKVDKDVSFKHTWMGKIIIKSVSPAAKRNVKTFTVFEPSAGNADLSIIDEFKNQHKKIIGYIDDSGDIELKKIKLASPASKFVRYNMGDAFGILVYHTQRHLDQIERVKNYYKLK